jgi:hypothetical protein
MILMLGSVMQELIRRYTYASVARGCGFGALAIVTTMIGCAGDVQLFLRTGGITTLLMCFILIYKATRVYDVPYKSTEVWTMLPKDQRPPEPIARTLIAESRREVMLKFAYAAALVASIELAADLVVMLRRLA